MSDTHFKRGGILATGLLGAALVASLSYGITEEVKFGTAEGVVTMKESGKALPSARVIFQPQFDLPEKVKWRPSTRTDKDGKYSVKGLPAGVYEVQVYGKAHSGTGQQVLVTDSQTTQSKLVTELTSPELELRVSQRVLAKNETPQFEINGVTRDAKVSLRVLQVGSDVFKSQGSLYDLTRAITTGRNQKNPATIQGLKEVRKLDLKIDTSDVEGAFAETETLKPLNEGVYLVQVRHSTSERYAWLTVTDVALITKVADRNLMAYAVDIKSGKPVPQVPVSLFINKGVQVVGRTDDRGIATFTRPKLNNDSNAFVVGVERGNSRAFAWMRGWDDNTNSTGEACQTWIKTDRPIYRPGDMIQFKGISRIQSPTGWVTPKTGSVQVTVYDPDETVVSKASYALGDFGTFAGSFTTNAESAGSYRIEMNSSGSEQSQYLSVVPFRKPEYTVTVTPKKKVYRKGDQIEMLVKAEYYTGEPVAGAPVTAQVKRSLISSADPFNDGYSPWMDSEGGDFVENLSGRTNASGEATFTYASGKDQTRDTEAYDARYTFEASVADPSDRYFTGSGGVLVTRGLAAIESKLAQWIVKRDSPAEASFTVTSHESGKPLPGQEITVSLRRVRWEDTRGNALPKERETILKTEKVTTDPEGKVKVSLTPDQEGDYRILAEFNDTAGNRIVSQNSFWCTSESWEGSFSDASLQIVLSKEKFGGKENVTGVIQASSPGGSALVTVEGKDVIEARVVPLTRSVTSFDLGPLGRIAPGAEIKVAYIQNKKYFEAQTGVEIELKAREVKIDVSADRAEAKPGEEVTYSIRTTDDSGAPVRAEVSLGVVDEGIYQIQEDNEGPLSEFYQPQYSMVQTEYSFPELYLDGEDKSPKNVQLRKTFVDTAFWSPQITTDQSGSAKVSVKMPDNLTSWRATATAVTADSRMGQSKSNLIVRKELMARLNPPAFMVQFDEQSMGAVIANGTDKEQKVTVKLGGTGLDVEGQTSRQISIPARASERLEWPVKASEFGEAKMELTAIADGGLNDGLEMIFPVYARASEFVAADSGTLQTVDPAGGTITKSTTEFKLERAENAVDGSLEVRVDPSPLSSLIDILPGLIDFPYGCVEQTLSRFQPAIAVQKLASETGISVPELSKLPSITKESLARLKRMQHADGGWGWWEYDQSSSLMTAAVLEGLYMASQSGVKVEGSMISKALQWTDQKLEGPRVVSWDENTPYLAYSRTLWGATPRATTAIRENGEALYKPRKNLEPVTFGDWATSAIFLRQIGEQAKAEQAYSRLKTELDKDPGKVLSEEYFWGETRGRVLQAVSLFTNGGPEAKKLLYTMLSDRRRLEAHGTRAIALVVNAAATLISAADVAQTNGTVSIEAAGMKEEKTFSATDRAPLILKVGFDKLTAGQVPVKIVSEGSAGLYQAKLKQMLASETFPAQNAADYTITRTYHRVVSKTMEDGTIKRETDPTPTTQFKSGEIFKVKIVINTQKTLNYVLVEDPAPSNCVFIDTEDPYNWSNWTFWWDKSTYGLDKAAFFKRTIEKGRHEFEYGVRAESQGSSLALPSALSLFYEPGQIAKTDGLKVTVSK